MIEVGNENVCGTASSSGFIVEIAQWSVESMYRMLERSEVFSQYK